MYILTENKDLSEMDNDDDFVLGWTEIKKFVSGQTTDNNLRVLYNLLKPLLALKNIKLSIDIISDNVDGSDIDIFYTDGSLRKSDNTASYACCKLIDDPNATDTLFNDFLQEQSAYTTFSGTISNGTNSVGELTGIKVASENLGNKKYQLIISDSEYGVKAFREWYHTWKNNGFKSYSNKPVKHEQLIRDTYDKLFKNDKIIFLKWTRGHEGNSFNEKCDKLAKEQLGIGTKK